MGKTSSALRELRAAIQVKHCKVSDGLRTPKRIFTISIINPPLIVDLNDPNDMNIIRVSEISSNIVNQCGRTINGGNIDVGAKTENALATGNVTQVTKGSDVTVTMSANSTMASGTYTCDLDPQGNVQGATGQTKLQSSQKNAESTKKNKNNKNSNRRLVVRQSVVARASKATGGDTMTLTVTMPNDLACIGGNPSSTFLFLRKIPHISPIKPRTLTDMAL
jgi:hypothetical protein